MPGGQTERRSHDKRTPKPGSAAGIPADEKRVAAECGPGGGDVRHRGDRKLVHVEFLRDRGGRVLRLFIDKPAGVTLEDCATVSRELGDVLDVQRHLPDIGAIPPGSVLPGAQPPVVACRGLRAFQRACSEDQNPLPDGRAEAFQRRAGGNIRRGGLSGERPDNGDHALEDVSKDASSTTRRKLMF